MMLKDSDIANLRAGLGQLSGKTSYDVTPRAVAPRMPDLPTLPLLANMQQSSIGIVQQKLAASGFYQGPVTGQLDPATAEAVKNFKRSIGLPANGEISTLLLEQLGGDVINAISPAVRGVGSGANPTKAPDLMQTAVKFTLIAAGVTAAMAWLGRRRQSAAVAEAYEDVAEPEDFDEIDDSELVDGEDADLEDDDPDEEEDDES